MFLSSGRDESVNFLIDRGADVNSRNNNGDTPLHEAALNGNLKLLISNQLYKKFWQFQVYFFCSLNQVMLEQ